MANIKKIKLNAFKFQPFSKKQMQLLTWWQEDSPVSDRFICVADGSIRSGKAEPYSAKLYTPDGYKLMGDIKIGDYVFSRTGEHTRVLGVYPQGNKDVYEITFHDGSKCRCCKEHLWTYTTKKCVSNNNFTMFTSTLAEIIQDLERFKDRKLMHQRAGKYRFPMNGCVQFEPREVKIDPYLLGLRWGDGCFSENNCGITFINEEDDLHDYIRRILPSYGMEYIYIPRTANHCAYGRLARLGKCDKSELRVLLESYGLFGCKSESKFIPIDYKYNSKEVRYAILAGLLNTDGSALFDRPSISYCTVSKQLYDDVAELARSLGLFVNTDKRVDTREKNKHICYELNIRVNKELNDLLSLKHKNRLRLETSKSKGWKMIKSIEYVGKEECQCIYVDNEEHLYLTDDFIVTHNTICMITSFVLYIMTYFEQQNAAIAGKDLLA